MNCHDFREVMARSIDGELDSKTRKEVGLHLAGCEDCLRLISEDKFWDDALVSLLDREAPADLRADILGNLDSQSGLSGLQWKKQMKLMAWGARRKANPWDLVKVAAIAAGLMWLLPMAMEWQFPSDKDAFKSPGCVALVSDGQLLTPENPLVSGSLSFEGRLF